VVRRFADDRYQKLFERIEEALDVDELTPSKLREFMGVGAFNSLSVGIRDGILASFIAKRSFVVVRGRRREVFRGPDGRFIKNPDS